MSNESLSRRLLIVEDEEALRGLLIRYLGRCGYESEAFASAEDALVRYQAAPQGFSLVVTDLALPVIGGEELIVRMRALNPGQRFLILSGHPYQPTHAGVSFLQKPFLPKALEEEIVRALK